MGREADDSLAAWIAFMVPNLEKSVALDTFVSRLMGEAMDRVADDSLAAWIAFMVPDLEK